MELNELKSVAQCDTALEERNAEIEKILSDKETRQADFENADVDGKEKVVEELETMNQRYKDLKTEVEEIQALRSKLEDAENRFNLANQLTEEKVEKRKENIKMNLTEKEIRASEEYLNAYVGAIKTGKMENVRAVAERAGLKSTDDGVPVPTVMQGYVETAWEKFGRFSSIVRNVSYKGLMSIPVETDADDAVWHAEGGAAVTEESITLDTVLLQPVMIKKWISLTDELMALAPAEFLRYVADELVEKVVRLLDDAIISGTGTSGKGVIGIVNDANSLVTKENIDLTFNTHNILASDLIVDSDIVIAMNPKTFLSNIMGMVDDAGRPIYNVMVDNSGVARRYLGGYRVEFTNALKAFDSASTNDPYMVVGNFSGYTLNRPEGQNVITLTDPYTLATEDKQRMIARMLCAGAVTKPKYFAVATKKASA